MPIQLPRMSAALLPPAPPLLCQMIGVAMRSLSSRRPITGRLGTRHLATRLFRDRYG